MKLRRISKKGQLNSIIVFAAMVFALILLAPIVLKMFVAVTSKTATAIAPFDTATNQSQAAMNYGKNTFLSMFDWILLILFLFNVILVLITAFLVDVHPAFLIIYILGVFFLILTMPAMTEGLDKIWTYFLTDSDNVIQYLPLMNFVRNHFIGITLGIIILSGIIMFGKYRMANQGGGNYY